MTTNEKIVRSAIKTIHNQLLAPVPTGLCLRLVRIIVEDALKIDFYQTYRTHVVERVPGDDSDPWARDLERSFRENGFAVCVPGEGERYIGKRKLEQVAIPGDLLFRHDVAPTPQGTNVGHVGILIENGLVIENVNYRFRSESFQRRGTCLTPLSHFKTTLVARIP